NAATRATWTNLFIFILLMCCREIITQGTPGLQYLSSGLPESVLRIVKTVICYAPLQYTISVATKSAIFSPSGTGTTRALNSQRAPP
ncbi:MAG: hypothetical protein OEQ18_11265, partial [Gammaproteobacteria bacterium]|nr:hypothetical protein [Gammaproteobacteria bacterium]